MKAGAAPAGARDPAEAAHRVREMFARVTPRYDLLNHLLSFNQDRRWRALTARRLRPRLSADGLRAVDLCCGTGDLLRELRREMERAGGRGLLLGADFCRPMLLAARRKLPATPLIEADALRLPLPDGSLDLITVAFGFRNLADYRRGLAEMRRVLRPNGVAAILEFSRPRGAIMRSLYAFYSRTVLPLVGGLISGSSQAYRYLPASVRSFPGPDELAEWMREAGFRQVWVETMSSGIVALHLGVV